MIHSVERRGICTVQYTLIEHDEAPPRPMARRGGRRHREVDALIGALSPGKVARIELAEEDKPGGVRKQLFEAAARTGRPVEVWEQDGVIYAGLAQREAVAGG